MEKVIKDIGFLSGLSSCCGKCFVQLQINVLQNHLLGLRFVISIRSVRSKVVKRMSIIFALKPLTDYIGKNKIYTLILLKGRKWIGRRRISQRDHHSSVFVASLHPSPVVGIKSENMSKKFGGVPRRIFPLFQMELLRREDGNGQTNVVCSIVKVTLEKLAIKGHKYTYWSDQLICIYIMGIVTVRRGAKRRFYE